MLLPLVLAIVLFLQHDAYCSTLRGASYDHHGKNLPLVFPENHEMQVMAQADPEVGMDVVEMVRYNGYPAEEYDVTTADGYIITIQRIPYGKSGPGNKPRQPVVVQHGMGCASILWTFNTPAKSLAFILADEGYDVWLSNIRGSIYGQKSMPNYEHNLEEFWEFSFDEMARYDMPAIIDFVLAKTGFSQTNYIGHSMGTTIAFIMLSERPEYNAKIRSAMLMAPVISPEHMRSPLVVFRPFAHDFQFIVNLVGGFNIAPYSPLNDFVAAAAGAFCSSPVKEICTWLPFLFGGFDAEQFNVTRFPVYASKTPSGLSVVTLLHYLQLMTPGFRRYDYGYTKNMKKYGQAKPPMYNLNNVTAPIAMYWSDNDVCADPVDVALLAPQISNLVLKYRVPNPKFTHEDFVFAIDSKSLVYDKVIETMKKLWPQE